MEESRLGVIDSLSAGLNLVAERLWIIAIPVLLDLWYWRGPRLSIAPLFKSIEGTIAGAATGSIPDASINISGLIEVLDALAQQYNLFSLLSASLLGVPSLMANGNSGTVSPIEVQSGLAVVGLAAILMLAGLAIGCVYLTLIAQGVQNQPLDPRALLNQAGALWLRVIALGLLIFFFAVALIVPFSFLIGLLTLVSTEVASFLMGILYMSIIWLWIYLYFVVYAIILNRVGPIRAIWNSANVVARNFWSALGLVILIVVLTRGLALVWQRIGALHPIGMVIGIAGHAFIGSGLAAASLLFYKDRYNRWMQQTAYRAMSSD
ncbi:MAG: hypothetical protein D6791_17535 [Chloroflexi bacterium]|nr:MAG: hypothetical protein D6791_17535 [Chloroflexota bacterium]